MKPLPFEPNLLFDLHAQTTGHLFMVDDALQRIECWEGTRPVTDWNAAYVEQQIMFGIKHLQSALLKTQEFRRCAETLASFLAEMHDDFDVSVHSESKNGDGAKGGDA